MLNGGYIMVSKTDTNIYEKVNKALTLGKPILWYEDETTCYYIDTISKSGTDIVLTKGGKTITIEADGDIIETGKIQSQEKQYYYFDCNDGTISGDGVITDNIYMVFVSDIDNLDQLNKEDIKNLYCLALNSHYEDNNGNILNILSFQIYYDADIEKLIISVYQDGADFNDLQISFTTNPISKLSLLN